MTQRERRLKKQRGEGPDQMENSCISDPSGWKSFSDHGRATAEDSCPLLQNISGHARHTSSKVPGVTETIRSAEYSSQ